MRRVIVLLLALAAVQLGDQKGLAMLKTEIFQTIIDQAMEGLTK